MVAPAKDTPAKLGKDVHPKPSDLTPKNTAASTEILRRYRRAETDHWINPPGSVDVLPDEADASSKEEREAFADRLIGEFRSTPLES